MARGKERPRAPQQGKLQRWSLKVGIAAGLVAILAGALVTVGPKLLELRPVTSARAEEIQAEAAQATKDLRADCERRAKDCDGKIQALKEQHAGDIATIREELAGMRESDRWQERALLLLLGRDGLQQRIDPPPNQDSHQPGRDPAAATGGTRP